MSDTKKSTPAITREKLIDLLNEDLQREFQAVIAYVNYSQTLKGASYMNIAGELEELGAALFGTLYRTTALVKLALLLAWNSPPSMLYGSALAAAYLICVRVRAVPKS